MRELRLILFALVAVGQLITLPTTAQNITYSESFVSGVTYCPGSPQYDNWTDFRNRLDISVYDFTRMTIKGSLDTIGKSCVTKANTIAAVMKDGTFGYGTWCDGSSWVVDVGCSGGSCANAGDAVGINASNTICFCDDPGYIVRPTMGFPNWGGMNSKTCGGPSQTLTVVFEYDPCAVSPKILGPTIINCGDTVNLVALGGLSVIWGGGDTNTQIQVSPTQDTLITAIFYTPCDTLYDSLIISGMGIQNSMITGTDTICFGDSTTLTATTGYTYLWSTGDTTQSISTTPDTDSIYTVSISNACDIDTVTFPVHVQLYDSIVDTIGICYGEQLFLQGAWRWSAGTYYDSLISVRGCDSLVTTVLYINPKPVVNLGQDTALCNRGEVVFDAENPGATYLWQDGSSSQTFQINLDSTLGTKTIWVWVTDSVGCSDGDQVTYVIADCSDFGTDSVIIELLTWTGGWCDICGGPDGNYACNPPGCSPCGAWGPRSFLDDIPPGNKVVNVMIWLYWIGDNSSLTAVLNGVEIGTTQTGNGLSCGSCVFTSLVYGGLDSCNIGFGPYNYGGSNTLSLGVNGPTACLSKALVFLEYASDTTVTSVTSLLTDPSCNGASDGAIDLTITQGRAPFTFLWSEGSQTEDVSTLSAGQYNVTFIDSTGCVRNWPYNLDEPTEITPNFSSSNSACDSSNGMASVSATGGESPYTYQWDDSLLQTTDTAIALSSGVYSVTVTDSTACIALGTVAINDSGGPVLFIDSVLNVTCNGDSNGQGFVSASGGTPPYSYLWNDPGGQTNSGATGLAAGSVGVSVTDSIGCKGGIVATIAEPDVITTNISTILCQGDSVLLEGSYQYAYGAFVDSFLSISGCDSIIYTVLTTAPKYQTSSANTICGGDSILLGGLYRKFSGAFLDSLQSIAGCDSIVTTVLNVDSSFLIVDPSIAVCSGDSALIYGAFRLQTGIYMDSSTASTGCDSIHLTSFIIDSASYQVDPTVTTCAGDSILVYGQYESSPGIYYDSLVSMGGGCDSVHSKLVQLNPVFNTSEPTIDICDGDSSLIYGLYRMVSGIYFDSLVTVDGCDSMFSTELVVNGAFLIIDSPVDICSGDSILLYGDYEYLAGTYFDSLTTINGCDSVHSTILSVNQTIFITDTPINTCNGDSALIYGTFRFNAGTYYDSLATVNGCDSVHSTLLNVNPIFGISDTTVVICDGDSLLIYGEYSFNSGVYHDSLSSVNGCDSIRSTTLIVGSIYNIVDPAISICSGDTALIYGNFQNTTGTYYDSLISSNGCDSIRSTTLAVGSIDSTVDPLISICAGDTALIYGIPQTMAGTYYNNLMSTAGCDSVHSTILTIQPTYTMATPDDFICEGDSILIFGVYRKTAGTYYDSLKTAESCDSVISTNLLVSPLLSVSFSGLDSVYCSTDAGVALIGTPTGGAFSGTGGVSGSQFFPTTGVSIYTVTYSFTDSLGCLNSSSQSVTVEECIGIREHGYIQHLIIYPNPNTGKFMIEASMVRPGNLELTVVNSLGQKIYANKVFQKKGLYLQTLDLSRYSPGIYTVKLATEKGDIKRQVIIE